MKTKQIQTVVAGITAVALIAAILAFVPSSFWTGENVTSGLTSASPSASPTLRSTPTPVVSPSQIVSKAGSPSVSASVKPQKPTPSAESSQSAKPSVKPTIKPTAKPTTKPKPTTISLYISCSNLIGNMDMLKESKHKLVPANGVLYSRKKVTISAGDTVFDVLKRESRAVGLHMEYVNTPASGGVYIEGIGNLNQFDAGDLSGWMFSVNGKYPNTSSSKYKLKAADIIEWQYTLDLGRDLGAPKG